MLDLKVQVTIKTNVQILYRHGHEEMFTRKKDELQISYL